MEKEVNLNFSHNYWKKESEPKLFNQNKEMSMKNNSNLGLKPRPCDYKASALLIKLHYVSSNFPPSPHQNNLTHRHIYKDKCNLITRYH